MSEMLADDRGPYRLYHLNRFIRQFPTRDAALDYICAQTDPRDWEILDRSDDDRSSARWL